MNPRDAEEQTLLENFQKTLTKASGISLVSHRCKFTDGDPSIKVKFTRRVRVNFTKPLKGVRWSPSEEPRPVQLEYLTWKPGTYCEFNLRNEKLIWETRRPGNTHQWLTIEWSNVENPPITSGSPGFIEALSQISSLLQALKPLCGRYQGCPNGLRGPRGVGKNCIYRFEG